MNDISNQRGPPEAFLTALRRLIRTEIPNAGKTDDEKPGVSPAQGLTLFFIALDLAFFLVLFDDLLEHPFLGLFSKLVPALFGVALVVYLEKLRGYLLALAKHTVVAVVAVVLLPFLLLSNLQTVMLPVALHPQALVYVDDQLVPRKITQEEGRAITRALTPRQDGAWLLPLRGLRPHQLTIMEHQGDDTATSRVTLSRRYWLSGSVGSMPILKELLSPAHLELKAEHEIQVRQHETEAWLIVSGVFPRLYIEAMRQRARLVDARPDGHYAVTFYQMAGRQRQSVFLPEGLYTFLLRMGSDDVGPVECSVRRFGKVLLDFTTEPPVCDARTADASGGTD